MSFPALPDIARCACGGRASISHYIGISLRYSQVMCLACDAAGPLVRFGDEDRPHDRADRIAIDAWNARRNKT